MSADAPLPVVLCWHMHQPDYRGPEQSDYQLPWVYLHAIKDYRDMVHHLEVTPGARAVVNFAPVLLEQIDDYVTQVKAWLANGVRIRDPLLAALAGPGLPVGEGERLALVKACLRANEKHLVARHAAYRRLVDIARAVEVDENAAGYLNDRYLADLLVWYHLAWMGEFAKANDLRVRSLQKKAGGFGWWRPSAT